MDNSYEQPKSGEFTELRTARSVTLENACLVAQSSTGICSAGGDDVASDHTNNINYNESVSTEIDIQLNSSRDLSTVRRSNHQHDYKRQLIKIHPPSKLLIIESEAKFPGFISKLTYKEPFIG